jgi:hypothetical protein
MRGSSRKNFKMFRGLCGEDATSNIRLATTKWPSAEQPLAVQREEELRQVYWKDMLNKGSKMNRFLNTYDSAWSIIDSIIQTKAISFVLIQKELVEFKKLLPETAAGIALREELEKLLKEEGRRAQELKKESTPEMKARYNETIERIQVTLSRIQQLKVPISRKIMTFFRFNNRPAQGEFHRHVRRTLLKLAPADEAA